MKVFSVFSERKAGLIKVWAQSWEARGWTPQLISERELETEGSVRAAIRARGGGVLADVLVVNFEYPARRRPPRRVVGFGKPGWKMARLVRFPAGATEEQIRNCGRSLWD